MVLKLYFLLLVFSIINRISAIIISQDNIARLVNTTLTYYAGRLEMLTDSNQWSPICQANFNTLVATVACKSFGFVNAESFEFGYEFFNLNKTVFECTGFESELSECVSKKTHVDNCAYVTLTCTAIPLDARCLRVHPHNETSKGPLEILFDNEWRYVYDASWGVADAQVACRQLGFGGVLNANNETLSTNDIGLLDVVTDNFECSGIENYLYECLHDDWNIKTPRSSSGRVFLECVPVFIGQIYLRVAESTAKTSYSGVVEILYSNEWKPVLNTGWNFTNGIVTCRNLGFIGIIITDQTPSEFTGEPAFDSVKCRGDEESLLECAHGEWLTEEGEDAAVVNLTCIPLYKCSGIEYRLEGNSMSSYQGRLELKYSVGEDVWGSVCNTAVSMETAHKICSQLGFIQGAISISNNATYGKGTGYNVLQELKCTKDDESLIDCEYSDVIDEGCLHSNDVGVTCVPMSEEAKPFMDVQLEGSQNSYEGILKLKYSDGSGYGNVCGRGFSMDAADVICKELDFIYGAFRLLPNITLRERSLGIILMSDVRCTGNESKLVYCDYSYPGNCTHEEDVGVSCIPIRDDSYITLTDGKPGMYEGKVSVISGNDVVQVCPDNWSLDDSTVVCYELGNSGVLYYDRDPEQDQIDSSTYPILSFDCIGNETSLLNCPLRMQNIGENCMSRKGVRVECVRYLPGFFNSSTNTTDVLLNVDNFLKNTSLAGNLSSGSFGYFGNLSCYLS
ncbi:deleted in malignant brain tumors 1 protein-like [Anneissia japonica]|uniref:deleted in malignant brain tumors 1 protein-like n=1 Tax=Anneissia japonica TaxID=1529436 RepID=UPI00142587FE|nr:deleted in malignant brain tumors 1 protein-like [Anneissia japonica]